MTGEGGRSVGGHSLSNLLMLVAAVLMFLAAVAVMAGDVVGVPPLAWAFFSLSAWLLSATGI